MVELNVWKSKVMDDGTIVRVKKVFWRIKNDAGEWKDSDKLAVVIQRVKDQVETLKVDSTEAKTIVSMISEVLGKVSGSGT